MLDTAMCPVSPSSNSTSTASLSSSSSSLEEPEHRQGTVGMGRGSPTAPTPPADPTQPHLAPHSPGTGTAISGSSRRRRGCRVGGSGVTAAECQGPVGSVSGFVGSGTPSLTPHPAPHPTHRLLQQLLLRVDVLPVPPLTLDDDAVAGEGGTGGVQHPPWCRPPNIWDPPEPTHMSGGWMVRTLPA